MPTKIKSKKPHTKKEYRVYVYYQGHPDYGLDGDLRKLAAKHGGKSGGSGYLFPTQTRDIDFYFKDVKNRSKFGLALKKIKKKLRYELDDGDED